MPRETCAAERESLRGDLHFANVFAKQMRNLFTTMGLCGLAAFAMGCQGTDGKACEDTCYHVRTCQDTIAQKGCVKSCTDTFDAEYPDPEGCEKLYLDYVNCLGEAEFGCGINEGVAPKDVIAPDCAPQLEAFQTVCLGEAPAP